MEDQKTLFKIIDECIEQRGYKLATPAPDLDEPGDSRYEYKRIEPPRKTISAVWNADRGYFMIQHIYRRKIYDPGTFLIRFNELKDDEELIDTMNSIFLHWNQ